MSFTEILLFWSCVLVCLYTQTHIINLPYYTYEHIIMVNKFGQWVLLFNMFPFDITFTCSLVMLFGSCLLWAVVKLMANPMRMEKNQLYKLYKNHNPYLKKHSISSQPKDDKRPISKWMYMHKDSVKLWFIQHYLW